jgi:hypothetical protein
MSGSNSSAPDSRAAAPEALNLTVHSVPTLAPQRRRLPGRLQMLLVLAVCAAPVIASYFTYYVLRPGGRTNYSDLIDPQRPLPEQAWQTLAGAPVRSTSLKGQWLLVAVTGGACDAACEKTLYLQRQLRETLGKERDRLDKVWLVADDAPVRPEVLAAINPHGAEVTVLRVPREAIAGWLSPAPGNAIEQHLYIVDPMGNWMMRAPADPQPAKLKRDLEKLLRASSSWDNPGR